MTETTFKFADLNKEAKEKARAEYRETNDFDEFSYEYIYEDAVTIGALLGITIDKRGYANDSRGWANKPDIYFSGFYYQGDGACFQGSYSYKASAVSEVAAHAPHDAELGRIATELSVLQTTRLLLGIEFLGGLISASAGRSSHSGSMRFAPSYLINSDPHELDDQHEEQILRLMRDFADWIYERLNDEYDRVNSDEYIDERLQDDEFDENGTIV